VFANLRIGKRLALGFGALLALTLTLGIASVVSLGNLHASSQVLARDRLPRVVQANEVIDQINIVARANRNMALYASAAERAKEKERIDEASRKIVTVLDSLERSATDGRSKDLLREIRSARDEYLPVMHAARELALAGQRTEAGEALLHKVRPAQQRYQRAVEALIQHESEAALEAGKAAGTVHSRSVALALGLLGLTALLGVALAVWLVRSITRPLRRCADAAGRVAAGDLEVELDASRKDELGELAGAMTQMICNLRTVLEEMKKLQAGQVAGDIDAYIPEETFSGAYRQMAAGVNEAVKLHVDNILTILGILGSYAEGDLKPVLRKLPGKQVVANEKLELLRGNLQALIADATALSRAAVEGKLQVRADLSKHHGGYREVMQGVNATLDSVVDKVYWFENILDNIPFPISVTDAEMRWTFINRPVEKLLGVRRQDVLGKACESWNADICRTKECGIAKLRAGVPMTTFAQAGMRFQVDTAYLTSQRGERIGHIEVVQDITAKARIAEYQGHEIRRLAENLEKVARGEMALDLQVAEADEHTKETREQFRVIAENLRAAQAALQGMYEDSSAITAAVLEGRLGTRAEAGRHQGQYRKIVEGLNATLDAVVQPIEEASRALEALANADLRARVAGSYQGDHAKIKGSLNSMAEALHGALVQVAEATDQISAASGQIASSSQSVSQGASEQASALEETSATLEEISSMTKQNADNTAQAKAMAEAAKGSADAGSVAMSRMQEAMTKIRAAAEGTAEIIRDINEVAFQTNLLALNAAVEAARAGDAGRGFAVVAEEVRNLALRAKEAAKKTEELIKESVKLAGDGATISAQVDGTLSEIVKTVGKVTDIVSEIAAASAEQARGIDQVNKAVAQMDQVVQQSAANSEETSSAAEELSAQAQGLAAMVGQFQLERAAPVAPAAIPAAPSATATRKRLAPSNGGNGSTLHLRPEDVIPLESDPDFKNF
jgi:methyl-accepting chemotaxis protein